MGRKLDTTDLSPAGRRIVAELERRGWPVSEIAERTDVPLGRVYRYLRGQDVTSDDALSMGRVLGMPVSAFSQKEEADV